MTTENKPTSTNGSESCNTMTVELRQFALRKVFVGGKPHAYGCRLRSELGAPTEFDKISDAGWILITDVGSENLYFNYKTDDGEVLPGFCKCL